jgi:predicted kinase
VPFTIVECTAGPDVLRQRVSARQARHDDASEADVQVLEHLATQVQALNPSERACAITLDMQQPLPVAALAANWLRTFP